MKGKKRSETMMACALFELSNINAGSGIRIVELVKNLNMPFIHSRAIRRPLKYLRYINEFLGHRNILIFGRSGKIFDNVFLNFLRLRKSRIIYDVADIPHLQRIYFGGGKIDRKLEKNFYSLVNLSNILLVISQSQLNLMKYIGNKKTVIVPNASNPRFFNKEPVKSKIKNIIYVGGYAPARGIDELVAAFNLLERKHRNIRLKLVGLNMPLRYQKKNIIVERGKSYSDMPKIYSESYMSVIPHRNNPYMDLALPIKLFDSMAAARPIVSTNCFETEKLVVKEKCGIISEDTSISLAGAIDYLLCNPSVAEEMGRKGREAVIERHSWQHRAETIMNEVKNLN